MAFNLCQNFNYLHKIKVYESENHFYFAGEQKLEKKYNILTITKQHYTKENINKLKVIPLKEIVKENPQSYTREELSKYFFELGKKAKIKPNEVDFAIFGFVKFHLGYYAIMVSDITEVGKIGKYSINRANNLRLIPLFYSNLIKKEKIYNLEFKYVSLFQSAEFAKEMYFSYNYNMTKTLQRNFIENFKTEICTSYKNNFHKDNKLENGIDLEKSSNHYFMWNYYHLKEFTNCIKNDIWFVYFIYGYFEQVETIIYGLRFLVSVIARRNRFYAGTRYLKRGINNDGQVANDVESEQILEEVSTTCSERPSITSYVHIRGSVPIYWHQDQTSILPKPDIKLNFSDIRFDATKRHFYILSKRYGQPSVVCNLTKAKEKKPQETLLNEWYEKSVHYINSTDITDEDVNNGVKKIEYYHYDLKALRKNKFFYKEYCGEACRQISKTNMFCFIPYILANNTYLLSLQNGVIRSNCIDCLDRTNVYQQIIGTAVVIIQLRFFGVDSKEPENENEEIYGVLTEIYKNMGNVLSNQYAGSEAHKQTIKDDRSKVNKIMGKFPEMFNTFKRYFNNSFNDANKQCRINLFLGKYQIKEYQPYIWEIENDSDLHRVFNLEKMPEHYLKEGVDFYTKYNLLDDIFEKIDSINYITNINDLQNLAVDFNINIIQKLKLTKFNKKIPVLNYSSDKNEYIEIDKDDYLITFDNYLKYKRKNPTLYHNENLFKLDIHSFSLLNFENNSQVKSFENFKYTKSHKISSIWELDNNTDIFHSQNSANNPIINNKDFIIKINEDDLDKKNEEESKVDNEDEYFNYASFDIEEDITKKLNEYFNPNTSEINNPKKNKYGYFVNYKEEQHKFKKPNIIKQKKPEELYNEYYEDLKLKINMIKNDEHFIKKFNSEENTSKQIKKSESSKNVPNLSKKNKKKSIPLVILEEHFKK